MSNQKKQLPPQVPTSEKKAVMHDTDDLFYRLYAACLTGLTQRSDLEWHHEHLARRARIYAEAALKEIIST
jgi:hypothetical protein